MSTPRRALILTVLLTLGFYLSLLYAPPLNWDDDSNVFANPFFLAGRWADFWTDAYFGLYVPLTYATWQMLHWLGGGDAWIFRAFNALAHAANVILVYALLADWGRRRGWGGPWPAVLGAAFFALHPVQVATVAWISGGRDLLAAFFALVSLAAYARARRVPAFLAYAAALLAKPNVVTLPLAWLVVASREDRRRGWPWVAAGLALAGVLIWQTLGAQAGHPPAVAWWQRPWLLGDTYWFYLTRVSGLAPLAVNYARTPDVVLSNPTSLATAAVPYVLAAYAVWRRPAWAKPLLLAALTLLPVSGLVGFGYQATSGVADHYAYLTLAALAAVVADQAARVRAERLLAVGATLVLALCAFATWRRLDVYRSNEAFFTDMARAAPAAYATAIGMSNVACGERRDFADGTRWTDVALAARPGDIRALANKAYCLLHAGDARAVADLSDHLDHLDLDELERAQPTGYASFLASVGTALIQIGEFEVGYDYLCEAARVRPGEAAHRRNLEAARTLLEGRGVTAACEAPGT